MFVPQWRAWPSCYRKASAFPDSFAAKNKQALRFSVGNDNELRSKLVGGLSWLIGGREMFSEL